MIGLDTNVVVRYVTQDDPKQSKKANDLIDGTLSESNLGYITHITLVEITWVLESCYDQKKPELIKVLSGLLTTKQLYIERADLAHIALKNYETGKADYSDALISASSKDAGCKHIMTFDKNAVTIGMTKIK